MKRGIIGPLRGGVNLGGAGGSEHLPFLTNGHTPANALAKTGAVRDANKTANNIIFFI